MVAAFSFFALHADGRLVRLDVSAFEQIPLHDRDHRKQKLARRHHGRVERAAGKLDIVVSLQIGLLTVERQMGAVFLDQHVDHQRVGEFAFLHEMRTGSRSRGHTALRALAAGQLLALDHPTMAACSPYLSKMRSTTSSFRSHHLRDVRKR